MASHRVPPPPCPHCSQQLHPQHSFDGYQCRCGYTIGGESVVAIRAACASLGPDEVANGMRANGRIEQRPQFEPGIHISAEFSSIAARLWCRRFDASLLSPGVTRDIDIAVRAELQRQRLEVQKQEAIGAHMVVQRAGGKLDRLERGMLYGIAPVDQLAECARQMVHVIAMTRGPGRIWFLLAPVHAIEDDGMVAVGDVGGVPHVIMRSAYFHDPERETSVGRADRAIKEAELAARKLAANRVDPADFLAKRNEQRLAHLAMMTAMQLNAASSEANLENTAGTWKPAGRFEAVLTLEQTGVITREQARELLDMPEPAITPPHQPGALLAPPGLERLTKTIWGSESAKMAAMRSVGTPLAVSSGGIPSQVWPGSFRSLPDGRIETEWSDSEVVPLLVKYDGKSLAELWSENRLANRDARDGLRARKEWTKLQRDAVSGHLSDQLRAKVKASTEADKARQVSVIADSEEW